MILHVSWKLVASAIILSCLVHCIYAQGLSCNDTDIRLTGGGDEHEGRVEVCIGGQWGRVCNDSWDTTDAAVVCRQLGLVTEAPQLFSVNETTARPILLNNITCAGTETRLTDCPHSGVGTHNCTRAQDVAVSCPDLQPYLLFADGENGAIYRSNLDGSGIQQLVRGLPRPFALDFDYRRGYMFWSDVTADTISRAKLDGSEVRVLVNSGLSDVDGLSVDWVSGKLYWTDVTLQHIEVYDTTTGNRRVLIRTGNTTKPRAIVVDPATRWMYWSDWGGVRKIERASMDGEARQILHNSRLLWPFGLTLDYQNQVLYWIDATLDRIESSNVDGTNRQLIAAFVSNYHAFAISFFNDILYWSDWNTDMIHSIFANGTLLRSLTYRFSFPTGIEVVSENRQQLPPGPNPCAEDNGGCSYLCLLSAVAADGYTCTCPDHSVLDAHGRNCSESYCSSEGEIRLRGGTEKEGRVEMCLNNTWGTLCSNSWSDTEAAVACQQLGHASSFSFAVDFGHGGGRVHEQDMNCTGTESNLLQCIESGSGMSSLSTVCIRPAGVICEAPCRRAGYDTCCRLSWGWFGSRCFVSSESCYCDSSCSLSGRCCRDFLLVESCYAPVCNETDIRLVNGASPASGTLEICLGGRWGLVCSDSWDTNDAAVVCSQLGFPTADPIAVYDAQFGLYTTFTIVMDEVQCRGDETSLIECQHAGIGRHNCRSSDAAGVVCRGTNFTAECSDADVRLVGGVNGTFGRVEICFGGVWGTVCDDYWDNHDASVACRQLGLNSAGAIALYSSTFGQGYGPIFLDNVVCTGNESNLVECQHPGIARSQYCSHSEDAGVICPGHLPECNDTDVRLVGGVNGTFGRVEICFGGVWGTVCDDYWDDTDAAVVCRQLGISLEGAIALASTTFAQGGGPIFLDNVVCTGNETNLAECQHLGIGNHNCFHSDDAGVICPGHSPECNDTDVKLVDGIVSVNETSGRVEICFGGIWGTVCDDYWDDRDAAVVCRQLGLSSIEATALHYATFGRGDGLIFLDNVYCIGNEIRLADCLHRGIASHDCSHYEDAGVVCQGSECNDTDVRLTGGPNDMVGRVEICFEGRWGTVCDDSWDATDAAVVCTQLGLPSEGAIALDSAAFGEGDGPIFLDNVFCIGSETKLADCSHQGIALHNCFHYEDAGVVCPGSCTDGDIRLVDQISPTSGRVEVCFGGIWGTVCDDYWDERDAAVACRQLGFDDRGAVAVRFAQFGSGVGIIHLDNVRCDGSESRLANCSHRGVGVHNCHPSEDAGVICSPGPVERCGENRNPTVSITEQSYRFGGVCQAYEGGSTLCDGEIGERVDIYISNARSSSQSQLTSTLNAVTSVVFVTTSSRCQDLIRRVLCLYYYPPCGFNGTFMAPVSICPEECVYVQNECTDAWNQLTSLVSINLGFINCSNPGQMLDPLPHCCVDAGITMDTSTSIPVPTSVSTFSSSVAATVTSPFLTSTVTASTPSVATNEQGSMTSPVAAVVTVPLLFLLFVSVAVILVLLWLKRRRMMKAANRSIPLEILSWTRRNEDAVNEDVDHEPAKAATCKTELTVPNHYNPQFRERKLTPVMSGQVRQLTGKMLIPSSRIRLLDTLGHGEFGIVYKAHLLPQIQLDSKLSCCPLPQTVAVKTLKGYFGHEEVRKMMEESLKMKRFDHPNVISLIGVCIDAGPAPYIIMPFMGKGSLLSYLKKHRTELMPSDTADEDVVSDTTKRLISMCLQVAKGMEYLAEQKFVHRDLAARNCMVDLHDVIKVSDFGLTEDVYARNYFRQGREDGVVKLPVKWMSPESLHDGVFTEKTDVWSFGITCWEIFSGGKTPYPGVDPLSLVQLLENGRRLEKPLNAACSDTMYDIMLKCWQANPDERPPFSTLAALVSTDLERQAGYLDFSLAADGFSANTSKENYLAVPSPTLPPPPMIVVTQPDSDVETP